MRVRWWVALVWGCGLARLAFYAAVLPVWEGYDEWAHFAVVRAVAGGQWLVPRDRPVPPDVSASLRVLPVPWELRGLPAPARTHDTFWTAVPAPSAAPWPTLTAYEALQPPLYYWLMAPWLWLLRNCALATQVLALRLASVALASCAIPLVFALARAALGDPRMAVACAAVTAAMPGFAFDVARVSNDCLAVALFTALLLLAARRGPWPATGIVLGLGLLTKAYFLAALPLVLWPALAGRGKDRAMAAPVPWRAAILAVALSGWWYGRNLLTTGTLSGLSESVMLRHTGAAAMLAYARAVPWKTAVDSILLSHIYFGGWSSLTVRSWMYHVFYLAIAAAAVGAVAALRRNPALGPLALFYGLFWLAQLYNVVLIFASKGVPTSMGWYLYAVVGAEVVLAAAGLQVFLGPWAPFAGVSLFALLDLYAAHFVAIPYYTGLIRHRPNGALESLHLAALHPRLMLARLAAEGPLSSQGMLVCLWCLYLLATAAAVAAAFRMARRPPC